MVVLSGQIRYDWTARSSGVHIRAMGDQEFDICTSIASMTKYCEMVIDPLRIRFCLEKGNKGGEKLKSTAGRGLYIALLLFVGIPLPGTGAWTGTLAASILDMDFKKSTIAVMGGVILAGIIMATVSLLVAGGIGAVTG